MVRQHRDRYIGLDRCDLYSCIRRHRIAQERSAYRPPPLCAQKLWAWQRGQCSPWNRPLWRGVQTDGSAARHEKAVEENLHYLAVIKGRPDPGMSLADQMLRLHVPGVSIAVIHDKRIDWGKGYGVARLGGPPVSASTLFGAASMSKPLTAMAVLRLVQEGKIDLDADVNTYLKSWKIPAERVHEGGSCHGAGVVKPYFGNWYAQRRALRSG